MSWRFGGNFLPSLPSWGSPACYSIKCNSHLSSHELLWIPRDAVQCHHVMSLFSAYIHVLLCLYAAHLLRHSYRLCLERGLQANSSPSPGSYCCNPASAVGSKTTSCWVPKPVLGCGHSKEVVFCSTLPRWSGATCVGSGRNGIQRRAAWPAAQPHSSSHPGAIPFAG